MDWHRQGPIDSQSLCLKVSASCDSVRLTSPKIIGYGLLVRVIRRRKQQQKGKNEKETSVVGRCVFDRTAAMNNKILHSFLFFVCVYMHVCECKHIDGSVDRPGALSLFAVPSYKPNNNNNRDRDSIYIRRCVRSYASGGRRWVRPATGRQDGAACSVYIRDAVYRLGLARLTSTRQHWSLNFLTQFILWATRVLIISLHLLPPLSLFSISYLISFSSYSVSHNRQRTRCYSSACIYRNDRMRETSRLLIPTFTVSSNCTLPVCLTYGRQLSSSSSTSSLFFLFILNVIYSIPHRPFIG